MPYKDPDVQREYQRQWMIARRTKVLEYMGGCCELCGSTDDLEIDHRDREFKWTHRFCSYSWSRIVAELKKCQLLCRDCHHEKTKIHRDYPLGEEKHSSKLTETQVKEIRRLVASGETKRGTGRVFNISESTVRAIVARRTWTHI